MAVIRTTTEEASSPAGSVRRGPVGTGMDLGKPEGGKKEQLAFLAV